VALLAIKDGDVDDFGAEQGQVADGAGEAECGIFLLADDSDFVVFVIGIEDGVTKIAFEALDAGP
jgi:hypothetical protein